MQLFRFANPEYLYLLLLLPVIMMLFIFDRIRKKNAVRRLGDAELVRKLMPDISTARPIVKMVILSSAVLFLIIVIARPQFGSKMEEVKRQGVEVIIALDVSNSMLAEDIQPNRLERAKQAISRLVESLQNDKLGLIVFAGDAYTQIPVTTDYISAKMFLSTISPEIVPKQGTAIGSAIDLAMSSFSQTIDKSRALIIITDGENHEDDPVAKAKEAAEKGIVIYTIGIGSAEGVPISVNTGGRRDFMKDQNGNTVISKLDENILKEIAMAAGGKYVRANNSNIGLDQIFSDIRKLKKQDLEGTIYTEYNEQFQIFAAIALFLLLLEFIIMNRKNRRLSNLRLFSVGEGRTGGKRSIRNISLILFVLMVNSSLSLHAQNDKKYIRQGNGKYTGGKFPDAEILYRKAINDNKTSADAGFNVGDALYRQNKFEEAAKQFEGNAGEMTDVSKKADSYYNLGNSLVKANKFEEAIAAYKNSLRLVPEKNETRYNLAYAQDMLKQQQQQQQQEQQNKDKNQDKDNKQDKDKSKDQDKNKDQQDKKDQQSQQQQEKNQDQQQQQQKEGNISKEDAQRLLDALANDEKNVQEKVKEAKAAKARVRTLINW